LPELRKLVALVGDVLNEFEPAATPAPVVPEPAVLPFKAQTRRSFSRRRQWSALAAAACLLLTLGLAAYLPFSPSDASRRAEGPVAPPAPETTFAKADSLPAPVHLRGGPSPGVPGEIPGPDRELEWKVASADREVVNLEKQGEVQKARKLAEETAATVNEAALRLQKDGYLARAEPLLANTHELCQKTLGPDHPETRRTGTNHAMTYQAAVTAPAQDGKPAEAAGATGVILPPPTGGARPQIPWPGETVFAAKVAPGVRVVADLTSPKAEQAKEAAALRDRLDRRDPRQLKTQVVPVLTEALKKASSPQERETLARTLGHLGPAARDAVPVLTEYLQKSSEPREQEAILTALGQMGPAAREAAPALVESLYNNNAAARQCAAEALVRMGPAARGALPALNKRAESKDQVAQDVVRRLEGHEGRIGVCDDCDCFSVHALGSTLRQIHTLAETSGVEVLVETAPTLAAEKKADERAKEVGVRGVYLLMARDNPAVQVSVSPALQQEGLTAERVRAAVEPRLKEHNFDKALVDGVGAVAHFEQGRRDKKR
jgi:hypothetical protein